MPHRLQDARRPMVVGSKQTLKAVQGGHARLVYLARDAEERVIGPIRDLCRVRGIEVVYVDSMSELGRMCQIDVAAAAAAIVG